MIIFGNFDKLERKIMASLEQVNAKIDELGAKVDAERSEVQTAVSELKEVIGVLQAKILQFQTENQPIDYSEQLAKLEEIEEKVSSIYVSDATVE